VLLGHSFVLLSPCGWFLTFWYTPWDHRWWIITFLHVRWHLAALRWPPRILKTKTNFNKYFCYRILESGEGSAADTLQFSPTPPQTNLRGGVSHKGAWRIHPHLHQHRRQHHHTSRDYCTTFVVVKFSLLYEKFIQHSHRTPVCWFSPGSIFLPYGGHHDQTSHNMASDG
jgi:hypothetical protein